jgi:hypothetical protein
MSQDRPPPDQPASNQPSANQPPAKKPSAKKPASDQPTHRRPYLERLGKRVLLVMICFLVLIGMIILLATTCG